MNRLTLTVNGHMHKYSNRSFSKEEDKIMAIKKKPIPPSAEHEGVIIKDFFDLIAPSVVKFAPDHYIVGDTYRCVWAIKEYPPTTSDQAILCRFGEKESITLHVYTRFVDATEQRKIIQNATRKNRLMSGGTDIQETITAEKT